MRSQLIVLIIAALLALGLGACASVEGIRETKPLVTVAFNYGWSEAAECSARQIAQTHSLDSPNWVVELRRHDSENYAEIVLTPPSFVLPEPPIYVIDVRDEAPGKAVATIRASWIAKSLNPSQAEKLLKKCQVEPPN